MHRLDIVKYLSMAAFLYFATVHQKFNNRFPLFLGTRPPLIKDIPKPIEDLMTRCETDNMYLTRIILN